MVLIKHKSVNVSHVDGDYAKKDERVVRSCRQLDAAFVELLHRRAYGNIRVGDIAKKAGVGRATFYAHFSSKDDLLRSQFNRIVAPMLAIKQDDACPIDASAFFAHVQSVPHLYKALASGPEAGSGPRVLRDCFEERVRQALDSRGDSAGGGPEFAMQHAIVTRAVASSLLAVIECWVESNLSKSPQEVQDIFSKLVGGGLMAMSAPGPNKKRLGHSE
jgi:AcrR family transcriptional regulator